MRLLYCGDVVGRAGRRAVCDRMPQLRRHLELDFVIVNGENAAHGFGVTPEICREFYDAGVDVVTTGNHAWDRREIIEYIAADDRLLRPLNYPEGTPGLGANVYSANGGARRVMVLQVMGRLFMDPLDDPFAAAERALRNHRRVHGIHTRDDAAYRRFEPPQERRRIQANPERQDQQRRRIASS